jgi:hypothetical protein
MGNSQPEVAFGERQGTCYLSSCGMPITTLKELRTLIDGLFFSAWPDVHDKPPCMVYVNHPQNVKVVMAPWCGMQVLRSLIDRLHLPSTAIFQWLDSHLQLRISILAAYLFGKSQLAAALLRCAGRAAALARATTQPLVDILGCAFVNTHTLSLSLSLSLSPPPPLSLHMYVFFVVLSRLRLPVLPLL